MTGWKALWGYCGYINDMGLEADEKEEPSFFILTDTNEKINVSLTTAVNIAMVRDWMDRLETGIKVYFEDYLQFFHTIQEVFEAYVNRQ